MAWSYKSMPLALATSVTELWFVSLRKVTGTEAHVSISDNVQNSGLSPQPSPSLGFQLGLSLDSAHIQVG